MKKEGFINPRTFEIPFRSYNYIKTETIQIPELKYNDIVINQSDVMISSSKVDMRGHTGFLVHAVKP